MGEASIEVFLVNGIDGDSEWPFYGISYPGRAPIVTRRHTVVTNGKNPPKNCEIDAIDHADACNSLTDFEYFLLNIV